MNGDRAKLFMLEKRERAIVYAEEEYSHRKEALEKESANRKLEAQVKSTHIGFCVYCHCAFSNHDCNYKI